MNAHDLRKYQGMLAERRQLIEFMEVTKDPACIVVGVPRDRDNLRTDSQSARGVFIDEKGQMRVIIDQARLAALAQIARIETYLSAAGVTFEEAPGFNQATLEAARKAGLTGSGF